jgi:hypothetical protein
MNTLFVKLTKSLHQYINKGHVFVMNFVYQCHIIVVTLFLI